MSTSSSNTPPSSASLPGSPSQETAAPEVTSPESASVVAGEGLPACVLFYSRDIFFAPAVKNAALDAGCQFMIIGRIDAAVSPETQASTRACVVDLTPLSLEQVAQWGTALAERFPNARRIAFGPHVQVAHFAAAAEAGFDPVLAKGQVASQLGRLLQR